MVVIKHLQEYWRAYLLNAIFVCLLLTTHTYAYADEAVSTGEFRLLGDGGGAARLVATDVEVSVSGLLARVIVRQRFENTASDWREGEYVFPLPPESAVDFMAVTIGERRIIGKIREREAARQAYEAAKQAGRKASLISQQRPNLFTSRVANVGPGESIEVELQYLETLEYDHGAYGKRRFSLRVPTTLTPRYIPGQLLAHPDQTRQVDTGSGWARPTDLVPDAPAVTPSMVESGEAATLNFRATIKPGFTLDRIASLHHPAQIAPRALAYEVRLKDGARLDRDVVLEWEPSLGEAPLAAALHEVKGGDDYFLLVLMPPRNVATAATAALPRESIFVIDTSGSMAGEPIEQAKSALLSGLKHLRPGDRFNIVEFNSHTRPLWSAARAADGYNLNEAAIFIRSLHADGGTEMRPALEFAFRQRQDRGFVRQVVFITDGSVADEAELFSLIERESGNSRLFTVGIGSAPNSHFMQKAAEAGRGSFTFIGSQEQVERAMVDLFYKLKNPLMTNIRIDLGAGSAEVFPARIPDLYAGEPLTLALRSDGMPPGQVTITGERNGMPFSQQLSLDDASLSTDISKLWARRKLRDLYDQERNAHSSGEQQSAALKDEITQLALAHQLMSTYTSFIATEETVSRPADSPLLAQAIPNALPAGSAMGIPVPAGALGLNGKYLIGLTALLVLLLMHWRHKEVDA
ncbi:marine proteobacterial sortase target protein [Proteobacteria bacterium 005FR1]|nr:marine proteobacterial sortase target protein [Proteobacteria bacterium 005FR1]